MINIDVVVIMVVMSALFLRYAAVYKDPNKINYAPLALGLGVAGAMAHFILYADALNDIAIIKESLLAAGAGAVLAAVMSVMSRAVWAESARDERSRTEYIADRVDTLAHTVSIFEQRLEMVARMENATHEQMRTIFKEEIDALNVIQANQKLFVTKIESLLAQQHSATEKFEEFTLTELPGLDNVVHRHIDLLRISEQDHFNQLKHAIRMGSDENQEHLRKLEHIDKRLARIESEGLGEHTIAILHKELGKIVQEFGRQLQTIGAKSEAMVTVLLENDAVLKGAREQSELIMQQMVLSAKQMREITLHSKELSDSLRPLGALFASAETLHREFTGAQGKLEELVHTLETYERQEIRAVRDNLDRIAAEASEQIRILTQSLEQYQKTPIDTKNVQELSGRVKLHKSYIGENQA